MLNLKPKILTMFLARRFLSGVALVLLIISGIIFAITFVERLPGQESAWDAMNISSIYLLEYIPIFLPLVIFMGTLLTAYNLTRSSESVIISGAGLSPWQKMKPFLITSFLLGVFATCVMNPYSVKKSNANIGINSFSLADNAIWLRETGENGSFIIRAEGVSQPKSDELEFSKVSVFVQDKNSKFQERIEAKTMTLNDAGFSTKSATIFGADGMPLKTQNWARTAKTTPANFLERNLLPNQVSFWELPNKINNMRKMGLPIRGHLIQFWTLLFLPLTLIAMTTLGTAFSQTRERRNFSFGIKFSIGILVCFALYFVMNVFGALGASGALPTIIAILAPPLIITAFSAMWIVSFEAI
ncbi:MAG: LptF/LptG family permease [Alphaproteobacteria bacterium]|nr:LptF/LptG family permease [Alphaproteobacteria bacterium]